MSSVIEISGKTTWFSGPGYIAGMVPGIVSVNGSPAQRQIEIRERESRVVLATTISGTDGTYRFDNLDITREYDLIARDHEGIYNDVIASRVTPHLDTMTLLGDSFLPIYGDVDFVKKWKIIGGIRPFTLTAIEMPAGATIEIVDDRWIVMSSPGGFPISSTEIMFTITDSDGYSVSRSSVTPASWWRVNIFLANDLASTNEIEMASSINGANLCSGGEAFSNADYSTVMPARNAFDGNITLDSANNWASPTNNGWIAYHFPTPQTIRELRFVSRASSTWSQFPINFNVERSLDGKNWSVYRSFRDYPADGWCRWGWDPFYRYFDLLGEEKQHTSLKLKLDNNGVDAVSNVAMTVGAGNTFSSSTKKYGTHALSTNNDLDSGITCPNTTLTSNVCTLEGWFNFNSFDAVKGTSYPTSYHLCTLFAQPVNSASGEQGLEIYQDGGVWKWSFVRGGTRNFLVATLPTLNTWHHVAFCSNGTTSDLFLDGIKLGTFPRGWIANTTSFQIGYQEVPMYPAYRNGSDCFIDHVRITNGRVLYTDDFTPEEWE